MLPLLLAAAVAAAPEAAAPDAAEPPVPMVTSAPASLLGGEVMPVGNAQLLGWAGWPGLGLRYAQGYGDADAGADLRADYTTGEMEAAGFLRLPLWPAGRGGFAFRVRAGLYAGFGATWGRYAHRTDTGILFSPGLAWSTSAATGTFAVGLDLESATTFHRGGGLWLAPTLSASVEVPLVGGVTAGARFGLARRWDWGGAPGALRSPDDVAELVALIGYRIF